MESKVPGESTFSQQRRIDASVILFAARVR
jgi:hypothetical protein